MRETPRRVDKIEKEPVLPETSSENPPDTQEIAARILDDPQGGDRIELIKFGSPLPDKPRSKARTTAVVLARRSDQILIFQVTSSEQQASTWIRITTAEKFKATLTSATDQNRWVITVAERDNSEEVAKHVSAEKIDAWKAGDDTGYLRY